MDISMLLEDSAWYRFYEKLFIVTADAVYLLHMQVKRKGEYPVFDAAQFYEEVKSTARFCRHRPGMGGTPTLKLL